MTIRTAFRALALPACLAASAAPANDSVAELAAGGLGLVMRQTYSIEMAEEDLFVSPDEVRVRYVFHNHADHDIETLVAFPMPEIGPEPGADLPYDETALPENFIDFSVKADGRTIAPDVELRAKVLGIDVTDRLAAAGIPLNPLSGEGAAVVEGLDPVVRDGLSDLFSEEGPVWSLSTTYHWKQTFPAGKDLIVEHRYTPVTGTAIASDAPDFSQPAYAGYCVDDGFSSAVSRLMAKRRPGDESIPFEQTLTYILTTGANWRGPIGRFRLTVDKKSPERLVSFCGEGVRKTAPTQFTMELTDFEPERDLKVLWFSTGQ